jgi:hypothetical protein
LLVILFLILIFILLLIFFFLFLFFSSPGRFFWKVYREYARFENGEYLYRAIDSPRRDGIAADCIHAVTDIDQRDSRLTYLVVSYGDAVTRKFVRILHQRGRLMVPPEDTSWLDAALGLHCYPICHRPTP